MLVERHEILTSFDMTSKENELIKDVEGFHLDRDFKFEFRVVLANQNITILRF